MTLIVGDRLVIKRDGQIVEGEAYREYEVKAIGSVHVTKEKSIIYTVTLRVIR